MRMLLLCAFGALVLASSAWAETKLTLRGGYSTSGSNYPYAYDELDQTLIDSGYGDGIYGYVGLSRKDLWGGYGGEISFSYNRITDSDNYSDGGRCSTLDVISLSHEFCMEGAETANATRFSQIRVLATRELPSSGVEVMGGLGVLDFSSVSRGMMFFPGELSAQRRETDYTGVGLVLGARKDFAISGATVLRFEGFAGVYTGDRDLNIDDVWTSEVGDLSRSDRQTVYSLDLTASVAVPIDRVLAGGAFEFGVAYTKLFNVMDTTNYNSVTRASIGETGSLDSDVDAFSVFVGLQIPL
ncbi:hypothetical protein J7394_15695 [Ruegeria sp. R13_0]|uniref:hypothetical protein n=1 Tax=Ruegeria sp. R13_0 TaxID=2821099 RepID=UPI001ADA17FB|nr:hypothetical protein [Ruegeria sp. R13_0]MBO9435664.1 hypothetical protein [Ruegeria sp. R13_0]